MVVSKLRQEIYLLRQERKKIEDHLLRIGKMTAGSLAYVYNICGNPNCRCKKGQRHGPYPLLSLKINGKKTTLFIKKAEVEKIGKQVTEYKQFQKGLTGISRINQEIKECFHKIRQIQINK